MIFFIKVNNGETLSKDALFSKEQLSGKRIAALTLNSKNREFILLPF